MVLLKDTDCTIVRLAKKGTVCQPVCGSAKIIDGDGDIRDPILWERNLEGVDVVFHFAAQTSTYTANADPLADHAVNVLPMLHLLDTCRQRGFRPTVCFASTVTIAGIPKRLPVDESHDAQPLTVYDLHKKMAEQYLCWYASQGWVQGITLRLANVYGPGPHSRQNDRGILNQMIRRALAGEALTVYGAGEQLRDYLYIEDAARAFAVAAVHAEMLNGRRFVLGSGVGHSIAETLKMVAARAAARTGRAVEVRNVTPPEALSPIEQRNFVADSRQFREATGWNPHISLSEGIDRTMEELS